MSKEELSLEKLKIHERLQNLELSNARIIAHLESEKGTYKRYTDGFAMTVDRMEKILAKHDEHFNGNGKVGILTRIDRIEQTEKHRGWSMKLIWTSLAGLVVKLVHEVFWKQ